MPPKGSAKKKRPSPGLRKPRPSRPTRTTPESNPNPGTTHTLEMKQRKKSKRPSLDNTRDERAKRSRPVVETRLKVTMDQHAREAPHNEGNAVSKDNVPEHTGRPDSSNRTDTSPLDMDPQPSRANETQETQIANALSSPDEMNRLKMRVKQLEEDLSKSNSRLISALDRHDEQVKTLKKTISQNQIMISSMEVDQCSCSKSSGNNQNQITDIEGEYRVVAKKIRDDLRYEADDVVREVITYDNKVIRDWRGKVEELDGQKNGIPLVSVDGEKKYVAKCPMQFAMRGEYYTLSSPKNLLLETIAREVISDDSEDMEEHDRELCTLRISKSKYLRSWWSRVLSEQQSKWKTMLVSAFLEALGYSYIPKNTRSRSEEVMSKVREEQINAKGTLLQYNDDMVPEFGLWRLSPIENIGYDDSTADVEIVEDLFFKNHAAKAAFLSYRGHEHEHDNECDSDATILSLARADAWMTVFIEHMREDGKFGNRGGERTEKMKKSYKKYLPLALESILNACRLHVADVKSSELGRAFQRTQGSDPYGNNNRKITVAFRMPSTGMDTLAIDANYFMKKVSPAMGKVMDCYIGQCKPTSTMFEEIKANVLVHHESSDDENGPNELEEESLG